MTARASRPALCRTSPADKVAICYCSLPRARPHFALLVHL